MSMKIYVFEKRDGKSNILVSGITYEEAINNLNRFVKNSDDWNLKYTEKVQDDEKDKTNI